MLEASRKVSSPGKYKVTIIRATRLENQERGEKSAGGIDFRALPIATQPMQPLSGAVSLGGQERVLAGTIPVFDADWEEIEQMLDGGIIPSLQRIKEYLQASCDSEDCLVRVQRALSCIADILRLEEDHCSATDAALKEMLVLLESNRSAQELRMALIDIQVLQKEPELVVEH